MTVPISSDPVAARAVTSTVAGRPLWVRLLHWLIASAVLLMIFSGWGIYNASPIIGHWRFPKPITLGGWLGGAIQWHFAAMWVVVFCTLIYLTMNVATHRLSRQFLPLSPRAFLQDAGAALHGRLAHDPNGSYNAIQKAAYLGVFVALLAVIWSGLAIWKPVQLSFFSQTMGGFDFARIVHFMAMAFLVLFFVVHLVMVALVPRSLPGMLFSSRKKP